MHRAGDQQGLAQVAMDPGWHADNWGACRQNGIQNLLLFAPNLGPVLGFDPQGLGWVPNPSSNIRVPNPQLQHLGLPQHCVHIFHLADSSYGEQRWALGLCPPPQTREMWPSWAP